MNIAILTSPGQWYVTYAEHLVRQLKNAKLFFDHKEVDSTFECMFILSYHRIIPKVELIKHKHNLVIHESALPEGKGWAPMFWQILEGKNEIPFTMFEASENLDAGDIYMQKTLSLTGYELNGELREKQARMSQNMCIEFVNNYDAYKALLKQKGEESIYPKRTAKDSCLDIDSTLREQFNLLRIVNNGDYPAFFDIDGQRYYLKIEKA